jgi:hypothetical protein
MAKKYYEICPCNPANGGNGICGCIMGDQLIDDTKSYTTLATTSTNTKIEDSNSSNKKTAVDWLYDTIDNELIDFLESRIDVNELSVAMLQAKVKAKEMEKEQIIHAYGQGVANEAGEIVDATKDAEQYYNQKYKSK